MDGAMSQMQAAALLAALRTRDETVDEIFSTKSDASEFYGGELDLILSPLGPL